MSRNTTVIDLHELRKEKIEEKRREYERVVFRSSFGVYTVMEQKGLHAIEILDISEGGMQFQVSDKSSLELKQGDLVPVRFYFSSDNYFNVEVKVVRSFDAIESGKAVRRYGCLIDKTMASYSALYHFVQFITKCAEYGHKDETHLKIYY